MRGWNPGWPGREGHPIRTAAAVVLSVAVLAPMCGRRPEPSFGVPRSALPVCGVVTTEKVLGMSFDGGPGLFTEADLELLHRRGDHATFFAVGRNVEARPDLVRRELSLGMDVENHTWTHPLMPLQPVAVQRDEIERTQRALERLGVPTPTEFRPPYGAEDHSTVALVHSLGLTSILWEYSIEERVRYPNPDPLARARMLAAAVHPGEILLAHDTPGVPSTTTTTLQYLLPLLHHQGYRLVSVPELLKLGSPVLGHARWGAEVEGHAVMRGGCPGRWPV